MFSKWDEEMDRNLDLSTGKNRCSFLSESERSGLSLIRSREMRKIRTRRRQPFHNILVSFYDNLRQWP